MISARHWKSRRVPWHALVFWLWLSSFTLSFAASDAFHGPSCPEKTLLRWAGHTAGPSVETASMPVAGGDLECAACAFRVASAAILVAYALSFGASEAARAFAIFLPRGSRCRLYAAIARGPPRI